MSSGEIVKDQVGAAVGDFVQEGHDGQFIMRRSGEEWGVVGTGETGRNACPTVLYTSRRDGQNRRCTLPISGCERSIAASLFRFIQQEEWS